MTNVTAGELSDALKTALVVFPTQGVPLGRTNIMKKMRGAQNVSDILLNI